MCDNSKYIEYIINVVTSKIKKYILNDIIPVILKYLEFDYNCVYTNYGKQYTTALIINAGQYIVIKYNDGTIIFFDPITKFIVKEYKLHVVANSYNKIMLLNDNSIISINNNVSYFNNKRVGNKSMLIKINQYQYTYKFISMNCYYMTIHNNNIILCSSDLNTLHNTTITYYDSDTLDIIGDICSISCNKINNIIFSNMYMIVTNNSSIWIYKIGNNIYEKIFVFRHTISHALIKNDSEIFVALLNRENENNNTHKIKCLNKNVTKYPLNCKNNDKFDICNEFGIYNIESNTYKTVYKINAEILDMKLLLKNNIIIKTKSLIQVLNLDSKICLFEFKRSTTELIVLSAGPMGSAGPQGALRAPMGSGSNNFAITDYNDDICTIRVYDFDCNIIYEYNIECDTIECLELHNKIILISRNKNLKIWY
jgi:hypothetical protein